MRYLTLIPAYGRDYKSKEEVRAAWMDRKDFLVADITHPYDGKPGNRDDFIKDVNENGPLTLNIRFNKLMDICPIEINPDIESPGK